MKLVEFVDDVKHAWKWVSMQCMVAAIAIQGVWATLADDMKNDLGPTVHKLIAWGTVALLGIGVVGRVTKQEPPKD